jgi:hypothetical protein
MTPTAVRRLTGSVPAVFKPSESEKMVDRFLDRVIIFYEANNPGACLPQGERVLACNVLRNLSELQIKMIFFALLEEDLNQRELLSMFGFGGGEDQLVLFRMEVAVALKRICIKGQRVSSLCFLAKEGRSKGYNIQLVN